MALDSELLRQYAEAGCEDAFAEMVRRHLNLVYSAALRQVNGDAHLAQDVAQTVFTDLARKARSLSERATLTGWLYTSTHFAAAKVVQRRHQRHEQEAYAMHQVLQNAPSDFDWEKLSPLLDKVMHQLKASDRDLILMRFFENRQLAEIGERLGLSEDAARKRVGRALEKLRHYLLKRGITTASGLATVLSANAVQVAPAGLAATLTTASLAGATTATGTFLTLPKLMATTANLKTTVISAVVIASVITPLLIHREAQARLRQQDSALESQTARLTKLRADNQRLADLLLRGQELPPPSNQSLGEILRLRGQIGLLQQRVRELAAANSAGKLPRNDLLASMARVYAERVSLLKQCWSQVPPRRSRNFGS